MLIRLPSLGARISLTFALVGLFVTWMLSSTSLFGISLPCGASGDCDAVSISPASHILGVPIAYFGLIVYLALSALSGWWLFTGENRWPTFAYWLALPAAVASTGLTGYSHYVIRAHCMWCITSNVLFCLISMVLGSKLASRRFIPNEQVERRYVWVLCCLTVLVMAAATMLAVRKGNNITWDKAELAVAPFTDIVPDSALATGSAKGGSTVVLFADMGCPLCHAVIPRLFRTSHAHQFRFVLRHFPLPTHPDSYLRAVVTERLADQGSGWPFILDTCKHDYESMPSFVSRARDFGYNALHDTKKTANAKVDGDFTFARRLGLTQTPAIVVIGSNGSREVLTTGQFEAKFGLDD